MLTSLASAPSSLAVMRHLSNIVALAALGAAGALGAQQPATPKPIDRANLDTTCAACSDFYTFANGGWLEHNTIPAKYSEWGAFEELQDKNEAVVRSIEEQAAADVAAGRSAAGANVYKIGAFFGACMDTAGIETLGTKPIEASMGRIAAIRTSADLPLALTELEQSDGLAPFGVGAVQDFKNANRIIPFASQGGLSLPEKKYYTSTDTSMRRIRDGLVAHVTRMFELNGEPAAKAAADAQTVLAIETQFAASSMDNVQMRDPNAIYHLMTVAQFDSLAPLMHWRSFMTAQGAPAGITELIVAQPEFFTAMNGYLTSIPIEDWKTLLRWRLLSHAAPYLPKRFVDEDFNFGKLFTGQTAQLPRWQTCERNTNAALGEAVGQQYVARTFSPAAKTRAKAIVDNMVSVLHDRIQQLDWMSDSTKVQATTKLDAFTRKIGYPDSWRDYSKLQPRPREYAANMRRVSDWSRARQWSKVGKPIDRSEWSMTPSAVNAYYNPFWNEIVFPAGILQPPFYDPNADDAVNYGAMGAVIGHEMSHGFDDQGRRFDAKGNLREWWTTEDSQKYNAQAQRVVDQFNAYTVVDSTTHVNGKLTLGENIGDLGGLKIAYLAMEKSLAEHGRPGLIDGFTPEQRFFLAWAQVWRTLQRDAATKAQVNTDPHAPAKWRVNGPLSNMPEFKAAWGCKDGDPMVRADSLRAVIW